MMCKNCEVLQKEIDALVKIGLDWSTRDLEKLRRLWKEKPDETIWGETYDGGWSATPNILYEDWLKKFESIIVVSKK